MFLRVEAVEIAGGLGGPGPGPAARLTEIDIGCVCCLKPFDLIVTHTSSANTATLMVDGGSPFCYEHRVF